jgi:uncharacterized protein (TIGR02145 family)
MNRPIISAIISLLFVIPCIAQQKGSLIDPRDGITYETVKIGDQWWMAKNLGFIPYVSPLFTDKGIYVYDFLGFDVNKATKTEEYKKYGCLYNWKVANTVCPPGWHLPSDQEWKQLEQALGMPEEESDNENYRLSGRVDLKIMSADCKNDNPGNNESGFNGMFGGISFTNGNMYMTDTVFCLIRVSGEFWTSTKYDSTKAWTRNIYERVPGLGRAGFPVSNGHSVRCVRN